MLGQMLQQSQSPEAAPPGAALAIAGLSYQPPGTVAPLLQDVSMQLPANSMGLIYGRSGAGKTTLLKIIGGLAQHDCGLVRIGLGALDVASAAVSGDGSNSNGSGSGTSASAISTDGSSRSNSVDVGGGGGARAAAARTAQTGLVFQFPERHFLGGTIGEELTFGWPQRPEDMFTRQQMTMRLGKVLQAVGLDDIDLQASPTSLSDGYKRRLALAVQLARGPSVLLLDEPLAGLDWRARSDIAELLGKLKKECTIVVVSHDLHELSDQVDTAWEMLPGGRLDHRPNWRATR